MNKAGRVVIVLAVLAAACGGEKTVVDAGRIVERNGLKYELDSGVPFTGTAVKYYADGKEESVLRYRDGRMHGRWVMYYPSGKMMAEGDARDGAPHGKWVKWFEDGGMQEVVEYRHGEPVSSMEWNRERKLIRFIRPEE